MKKFLICCFCFVASSLIFCGCDFNKVENGYLRIHIRANSNLEIDQNVKHKVKDEVVEFLTPLVAKCNSLIEVKNLLNNNLINIENVCNIVLKNSGFNYFSKAKINKEFFPTRAYGKYVLDANVYDALIIELGTGNGDNWWCVVYPPLCFLSPKNLEQTNFKYKSRLYEIIKSFFD